MLKADKKTTKNQFGGSYPQQAQKTDLVGMKQAVYQTPHSIVANIEYLSDKDLGLVPETDPAGMITIGNLSNEDLGLVSEINLVEKDADPENWKQMSTYI